VILPRTNNFSETGFRDAKRKAGRITGKKNLSKHMDDLPAQYFYTFIEKGVLQRLAESGHMMLEFSDLYKGSSEWISNSEMEGRIYFQTLGSVAAVTVAGLYGCGLLERICAAKSFNAEEISGGLFEAPDFISMLDVLSRQGWAARENWRNWKITDEGKLLAKVAPQYFYSVSYSEFVKKEDVKDLRRHVKNYKRFMNLKDEWIDLSIQIAKLRKNN
jgi:hypothetical protein